MSNEKKPGCLGYTGGRDNTTQLHGDHFTNNYKDPMKRPVHPGRLRAGTPTNHSEKENDVPNLYDCGPAVNLQGCMMYLQN